MKRAYFFSCAIAAKIVKLDFQEATQIIRKGGGCMKSLHVHYDEATERIEPVGSAGVEDWVAVCARFNDDVHRIRDIRDQGEYTGLYACIDEENATFFFLVQEDATLKQLRRRVFLGKLGRKG
jgi:hypothetical protein